MPNEHPVTLLLDVCPGTTTVCDMPGDLNRIDSYDIAIAGLCRAFTRPTRRYNYMSKRMTPGPDFPLISQHDYSFDTGILQYVVTWWLRNVPNSHVVLLDDLNDTEITRAEDAVNAVTAFFCVRAGLPTDTYKHPEHLKIEMRDYLPTTINAWLKSPRGIWQVATNGGKTYMLGALVGMLSEKRFLITVPHQRSSLVVQGAKNFRDMGHKDVAVLKGGPISTSARIVWAATSTLTTRMTHDAEKTLQWMNGFDILVKDECHEHSAKERWLYRNVTIWARLGMSGTPLRDDAVHDATTIGNFGPILHAVSNTDLINRGVSKQPHVFVCRLDHAQETFSSYSDFHNYIVTHPERNAIIVRCAVLLRSLGHFVVVSTSSVHPHAETLTALLHADGTTELYDGSQTAQQRSAMLHRLATRQTQYLVASKVFDVGVSEDCISAIIFAGPMGKNTVSIALLQKAGRGLRRSKNTTDRMVIVDFQDITQYGTGQARRRLAVWKKDEAFAVQITKSETALYQQIVDKHYQWKQQDG